MSYLNQADLDYMRASVDETLPDTCTLQDVTRVNGPLGSEDTYSDAATLVPCRVSTSGNMPQELRQNDAVLNKILYYVTLQYDKTLNPRQRIVWNSKTLEVITERANSWQVHKRVVCIEVG